jgi:Concanavalin A-like lectin/glucanases superfamily
MPRLVRRALAAPLIGLAVLGAGALLPAGVASASTVVALWHMNNKSGTLMYDSSGHGNNGTTHNVTPGAAGVSGNAYSFNGKSSYAEAPNSSSLNPGSANISISFYLNTTHLPKTGDYDLVRKGDYPAEDYKVELLPTGQIKCTFQGSASRSSATGGSGLNNGAWHHVQCIKTASQIQTVIDGKVAAITKATVGSISNTSPADIGAHPSSDWYNGELDEVSIAIG